VNGEGFHLDAKPPILLTDEISTAPLSHTGPEGTAGDSPGPWQRASGCCHRILCRHHSQPQHSDGVRARALHIKRRAEPAALIYSICCHTLRTTGLPRIYGTAERWSTHRPLPITNRREPRNYMTEPRGTVVRGVERIKSERLYIFARCNIDARRLRLDQGHPANTDQCSWAAASKSDLGV
jgi:hypothetical protein